MKAAAEVSGEQQFIVVGSQSVHAHTENVPVEVLISKECDLWAKGKEKKLAVLEEALLRVRKAIEEGRTIVDPLRESGVFPNMVTQMIGVGEATGAMDAMLQKIADLYEDEVDSATKDMLAMLEPIIIGLLGVMIGGIVISLYMPLFSMIAKLAG